MALLPVADALALVLREVVPLPSEKVPLLEAHGRVLAADMAALRTQPPAAMSAMDGYAVRAADIAAVPANLTVAGRVAAGHSPDRPLGPGEAIRIFTGGVLPAGADTVVIQENTEPHENGVTVLKTARPGANVRPAGLDFRQGDILLRKGRLLSGRDLSLAAAMNHPEIEVHRRPSVAMLATGDELVMPGSDPGPGQIVYSNGYAVMALARREGAQVHDLGIAADTIEATVQALRRARSLGVDVLVTSGGASVGDYDLVQQALVSEGMALRFWKIAMRPGKPMMNGRLGGMHVLGVPGNPVSAFVCALLFMVPLLRTLGGRHDTALETGHAVLGADLPANDERADYIRATLAAGPGGRMVATPWRAQDSSMLGALAAADCLIIRDIHAPAAKAGAACVIAKLPL